MRLGWDSSHLPSERIESNTRETDGGLRQGGRRRPEEDGTDRESTRGKAGSHDARIVQPPLMYAERALIFRSAPFVFMSRLKAAPTAGPEGPPLRKAYAHPDVVPQFEHL